MAIFVYKAQHFLKKNSIVADGNRITTPDIRNSIKTPFQSSHERWLFLHVGAAITLPLAQPYYMLL
jgi:hypothetical protein